MRGRSVQLDEDRPHVGDERPRLGAATCAFGVLPAVVLLLGFVGATFDGSTRLVARLAAAALVVAAAASWRRWGLAVTVGAAAVYVTGTVWVFALPDGRHPVVMGYLLLVAVAVVTPPVRERLATGRPRAWVVPAALAVAAATAYALAVSPLPLRVKVAAFEGRMEEQAQRDLAAGDRLDRAVAAPATFGCFGGRAADVSVGPFPVCHRSVTPPAQLTYDLGRPVLGVGDRTTQGLIYAPAGPPHTDGCLAPVTGAWYEYTRPDGTGCPPGQSRG